MIILKSSITFEYPAWFILICLLIGVAYAFMMYYRDNTFKDPSNTVKVFRYVMASFRFLGVSLLAMLLLSPFIKTKTTKTEKPVVVIAQDNSESIANSFDNSDSAQYLNNLKELKARIEEDFEVVTYKIGDDLTENGNFDFKDKVTNLSSALDGISDMYYNQNLGAVIFATDGIYNQGINPVYTNLSGNYPIYTIAIGDTTPTKDMRLGEIKYNDLVYLDDRFSVNIDVNAYNLKGERTALRLYHIKEGTNKIWEENVTIDEIQYNNSFEAIVTASQSGVQHYRITLDAAEGEESAQNNYKDIFIEVIDSRQNILILAYSPHPDISALKSVIESDKNYEVDIEYLRNFTTGIDKYDLVILHQIPAENNRAGNILQDIKDKSKPVLSITGSQYRLRDIGELHPYIEITDKSTNFNEVTAVLNPNYNLFKLSETTRQQISRFPPLFSPFAEYKLSPEAKTLLFQRIGKVQTDYPLMVFNEAFGIKTAVICGEGLWRWRMYNYQLNKNFDAFDELMNKTFQFLTVKSDKRKFRVSTDKNIYYENESVRFSAQLYNDNYELVNEAEVKITIKDEEGNEYPFTFNRTYNAYELDAGFFKAGNYSFTAQTEFNNRILTASGKFSVSPLQLEALESQANHQILYMLAEKTGGQLYYPDNMIAISEEINETNIKPVMYTTFNTNSAINLKWIFFLILGLIAMEWFLRKYFGGM